MSNREILTWMIVFTIIGFFFGYLWGYEDGYNKEHKQPTKVCRDGSLYEVTHEGNITIFDRKDFMTCEEK